MRIYTCINMTNESPSNFRVPNPNVFIRRLSRRLHVSRDAKSTSTRKCMLPYTRARARARIFRIGFFRGTRGMLLKIAASNAGKHR